MGIRTDHQADKGQIEFSPEFEETLAKIARLNNREGMFKEPEVTVLRGLAACLGKPSGRRVIPLKGMSPEGVERLQSILAKAGIGANYEPMRHHYRCASEPPRLVLD